VSIDTRQVWSEVTYDDALKVASREEKCENEFQNQPVLRPVTYDYG
jgi:hypothetical protein